MHPTVAQSLCRLAVWLFAIWFASAPQCPAAFVWLLLQREIGSLSCEPLAANSSTSSQGVDQQQQGQASSSSSGSNSIDSSVHSGSSSNGSSDGSLVVSLFEVPYTPDNVAAFIAREHEFRFLAVQPYDLAGKTAAERLAVSSLAQGLARYQGRACTETVIARVIQLAAVLVDRVHCTRM